MKQSVGKKNIDDGDKQERVIHLFVGPHSVLIRLWPFRWPWRNNTHSPRNRTEAHNWTINYIKTVAWFNYGFYMYWFAKMQIFFLFSLVRIMYYIFRYFSSCSRNECFILFFFCRWLQDEPAPSSPPSEMSGSCARACARWAPHWPRAVHPQPIRRCRQPHDFSHYIYYISLRSILSLRRNHVWKSSINKHVYILPNRVC